MSFTIHPRVPYQLPGPLHHLDPDPRATQFTVGIRLLFGYTELRCPLPTWQSFALFVEQRQPETMESSGKKSALEYGKPPWVFKGSALYQLHLVKAETARAFIPEEFKLVEAFGYTLGGFFLANYEDSPAGIFDELVIIAGIVWNPPTSCAWAARVLVNSDKACFHGRKDVGLPSQVANFTKNQSVTVLPKQSRFDSFLSKIGMSHSPNNVKNFIDIQVKETNSHTAMDICSINLNDTAMVAPENDVKKWMDPAFKISLPSFSGRTEYNPHLLKYSCKIECRLRLVPPAKVRGPSDADVDGEINSEHGGFGTVVAPRNPRDDERNRSISIMLSKPILALKFNCLKMDVEAPSVVSQ